MRVLIMGVGRIGSLHAEHLAADPRVGQVLVVDPNPDRRRVAAAASPSAVEARLEDALEAGIDAAVVATPSSDHFDHVSALLDAGVPTFCEKPLALTVEHVEALEERSREGAVVMVGFQRRFDAAYERVREAAAAAYERGEPPTLFRLATGDRHPPSRAFLAGAGSIYHDMLIHDFDVLGFLSPREVVGVTAVASPAGLEPGPGGWGTAAAVCELEDGALAVVTGSRRTGSGYEIACQVTTPAGIVALGLAPSQAPYRHVEVAVPRRDGTWRDFVDRFREAYRRELAAFVETVESGAQATPGPAEMLRALRLADAAEASAAAGGRYVGVGAAAEAVTSS